MECVRGAHPPGQARLARRGGPRSRASPPPAPATTQLPGSLTAAMSSPGARCSAMSSGPSATATMTPGGAACIRRARADTAVIAVGRSNTPARVAATYSPMLCPAIAAAAHAVGLDQFGQGVFHGEQRGLGVVGACQIGAAVPSNTSARRSIPSSSPETFGAAVELLCEHRLGFVQPAGHSGVLRALSGKQEHHPGIRSGIVDGFAHEDVVVLGGFAARAPPAAWSCTTAAIRSLSVRRPASVKATSDRSGPSGPDSSAAKPDRSSRSPSAVRADNSSTCGPGRTSTCRSRAAPPRRRRARWCRRRRMS